MASAATVRVEIPHIDVELLGPNCGVTVSLMRLDAEGITKQSATGHKVSEEHLEAARVTHVFQRSRDGQLLIVHEHISVPQT